MLIKRYHLELLSTLTKISSTGIVGSVESSVSLAVANRRWRLRTSSFDKLVLRRATLSSSDADTKVGSPSLVSSSACPA